MKKIIVLILSILTLLGLVACGESTPKKLENPVLSIKDNIVSWNEIALAESYYVYVDGILKSQQIETSYQILEVKVGSYEIGVKAYSSKISSSDVSKITYVIEDKTNDIMYSRQGYASLVGGFEEYLNTNSHIKVSTPLQFIKALNDAKYHYVASYDSTNKKVKYEVAEGYQKIESDIRIIELTSDLNLGYKVLSNEEKAYTSIVANFDKSSNTTKSKMFSENGISQIKIENTSNLLIFSSNGAKITHAGFKLTSDFNVVIRNIKMDEIWQWEDSASATTAKIGDYDAYGWAYFKISYSDQIWIDHCTFGKSYDGQIDYSNPFYLNESTAFRAPYGATGSNGLTITWCNFEAGSDDKNGYIYKMMEEIENEYKSGKNNYLYYNALRDTGYTFDEILYGIAIPQKKGFLIGDTGNGTTEYQYNLEINVAMGNNYFKNIEDRLPKLRGGNLYFYNNIIDCDKYYEVRQVLKTSRGGKTASEAVKAINNTWKCALVSQALLVSNGGFLNVENCIFIGVNELLKNNDGLAATYNITNSFTQTSKSDALKQINDLDIAGLTKATKKPWHTENGEAPFEVVLISTDNLSKTLLDNTLGVGTHNNFTYSWIKTNYLA